MTFTNFDFILVPLPAARMIAAMDFMGQASQLSGLKNN
jgi:hypothetical protein